MKTAILISGHYYRSKRRAGFHWIADALWRQGWRVIFVTAPVSWLSWMRRDHRLQYPIREEANRLTPVDEHFDSYVWWTRWHPANLRNPLLDRLAGRLFQRYHELPLGPLEDEVRDADLFVFESTPALPLFERFRTLNPSARAVYRVSDDISTLNMHPMLHEVEARIAPSFDLISSPTQLIHDKFKDHGNAELHPHGIPVNLYARDVASPYSTEFALNLTFIGISRFDPWFLDVASAARPDAAFHVIGPISGLPARRNVIAHGEMAFEDTIPYVKHADIGLHTLEPAPGAEVFADSLKVVQYTWCGLPIVAPCFLKSSRSNVVCYDRNPASVVRAIEKAERLSADPSWRRGIWSWDAVAGTLAGTAAPTAPAAIEIVENDRDAMPVALPQRTRVSA